MDDDLVQKISQEVMKKLGKDTSSPASPIVNPKLLLQLKKLHQY